MHCILFEKRHGAAASRAAAHGGVAIHLGEAPVDRPAFGTCAFSPGRGTKPRSKVGKRNISKITKKYLKNLPNPCALPQPLTLVSYQYRILDRLVLYRHARATGLGEIHTEYSR